MFVCVRRIVLLVVEVGCLALVHGEDASNRCHMQGASSDQSILFQSQLRLSQQAPFQLDHAGVVHTSSHGTETNAPEESSSDQHIHADQSMARHKTVHLLSQGRSGSSFLSWVLQGQGLPLLFEPDNMDGWGVWRSGSTIEERVHCMYTCHQCSGMETGRRNAEYNTTNDICSKSWRKTLAIKTVDGLSDSKVLLSIPETQLLNTKFVLLIRDPRAMLYSISKANWTFGKWDIIYGDWSCRKVLLQWLSTKEIAGSLPDGSLRIVFFEKWSQEVEKFVPELFQWAGLGDMNDRVKAFATSSAKASALEWTTHLGQDMIQKMNNAPYCKQYLDLVGYPISPSTIADFSHLHDPLAAKLTAAESQLLAKIRQEIQEMPVSPQDPVATHQTQLRQLLVESRRPKMRND